MSTQSTETKNNPDSQAVVYDLNDPALYINRELSLLEFNQRVLEEAQDDKHPLLERAKFLAICSSNLDEFFMIRVAVLKQQVAAGLTKAPADGFTPTEQLMAIHKKVSSLRKGMYRCFDDIRAKLAQAGIHLHDYRDLTKEQKQSTNEYFKNEIFPVLTPLAFDPAHPFPHISNLSLNLAVLVRDPATGTEKFARIKVPDTFPRLVLLKRKRGDSSRVYHMVWLEDLIAHNLLDLFPGYEVVEAHHFRVTRNGDLELQADEAADLLETIEATVRRRHFGFAVRLTMSREISDNMQQLLARNLNVGAEDIYTSTGPIGLSSLMGLMKLDRPDLKDAPYVPVIHPRLRKIDAEEIFSVIREGDILLQHPYHSFASMIDFLKAAARDPRVLAIKQTLYRAGKNSPVVEALMEARENDKQVSALVELKARFDEESNIGWAKTLESAGVHVVYGFMSLKTHSKICLVIRRDEDNIIRRYVHLSTGNYNAITANIYTDMGIFTCKPDFGADACDLFNALTGYSKKEDYRKLLVAPVILRKRLKALIDREIEWAQKGVPSKLIFKVNSLIDAPFIRQLYQASQAGIKIDLIIRGICGLRPGIPNLSDNIKVTSIVGRFLEHSRIYYFHNGGTPEIYLGSADIMPRNLDNRVETLFPIEDPNLKQELIEIMEIMLADNVQARLLRPDGTYTRLTPAAHEQPHNSQLEFMAKAYGG